MREQSSAILELQQLLRGQRYIVGPLDGINGPLTQRALARYQRQMGRPITGKPDKWIMQELRQAPPISVALPGQLIPTQPALWVELDVPQLTLFINGQYRGVYQVAIGKATTPSPFGLWRVVNKAVNPGGDFGARWLGIDAPWGSYGVHGTSRTDLLGKQVSNGCVRMFNQDVCEVFEHMFVGASVLFTGNPYSSHIFTRTVRLGDMGSDVYLVQEQLIKQGLLGGSPDGIFGPRTEAALLHFQRQHNLAQNGAFDKATRARMFGLVGKSRR